MKKTRSCGTCAACCTTMAVPELDKKQHLPCVHLGEHKGCGIYVDRPASCRAFECLWLRTDAIPGPCRPDRIGVVLDISQPREGLPQAVVVHEVEQGAASRGDAFALIRQLSRTMVVVLKPVAGDGKVLGPRALVAPYAEFLSKV